MGKSLREFLYEILNPRIGRYSLNLPIKIAVYLREAETKFLRNLIFRLGLEVVTVHKFDELVDQSVSAFARCAHGSLGVGETFTRRPASRRRYVLLVVMQQADHVVAGQLLAAVQEIELYYKCQAFDYAAERLN